MVPAVMIFCAEWEAEMGEEEKRQIVWILGAGFSKPLGGPLLTDLLSMQSVGRIAAAYTDLKPKLEQGCYRAAMVYDAGSLEKDKEWAHAEEFLERLDLALTNPTAERILEAWSRNATGRGLHGIPGPGIVGIRDSAVRMVAAEVCLFLKDADPEQEKWAPYRSWSKALAPQDTVITFNYDRVIELVANKSDWGLSIPIPEQLERRRSGSPLVLKLHGSVDWVVDGHSVQNASPEAALQFESADQMAIATPGPRKQRMIDPNNGPFAPLWTHAALAIRRADAIVFVGYRMPPTDGGTKQWLIDELRRNLAERPQTEEGTRILPVHTVLGPGLPTKDSTRLTGLLREVSPLIKPGAWDMGAEDFLGLVSRETLLRPKLKKELPDYIIPPPARR